MAAFYQSIEGWFDFDDIYELALRRCGSKPARFLEVGAYKGRSTCYLAERIRETAQDVRFDTVDTFEGDPHVGHRNLWPEFAANLERAGLLSRVHAHRCTSVDAAQTFEDQSIDFVFIDADHSFDAVTADIAAWWPKIRPGGLLAGHDYTTLFPGVVAAVSAFVATRGLGRAFRTSRSSWIIYKSLTVDAVYCISLARRVDRRERAAALFLEAGISPRVTFFDAIDGHSLSHPGVVSNGQAGCCASHLLLMHEALRRGCRHVLFFEDDVDLVTDFVPSFQTALARCPASYDLCYVGALCHPDWGNYLYPLDDVLSRAGNVLGTHAYMVNLDRLAILDAGLDDLRSVIDQWFVRELQPRGNCYVCTPYLAYQSAGHSDVAETYNTHPRAFAGYVWR